MNWDLVWRNLVRGVAWSAVVAVGLAIAVGVMIDALTGSWNGQGLGTSFLGAASLLLLATVTMHIPAVVMLGRSESPDSTRSVRALASPIVAAGLGGLADLAVVGWWARADAIVVLPCLVVTTVTTMAIVAWIGRHPSRQSTALAPAPTLVPQASVGPRSERVPSLAGRPG